MLKRATAASSHTPTHPTHARPGAVRVFVQLADLDERAALFRLPLVTDPQQLVSETLLGSPGGCTFMAAMYPPGPREAAPSVKGTAAGGGAGRGRTRALGPVLSDTDLLLKVLKRYGSGCTACSIAVLCGSRSGSLHCGIRVRLRRGTRPSAAGMQFMGRQGQGRESVSSSDH